MAFSRLLSSLSSLDFCQGGLIDWALPPTRKGCAIRVFFNPGHCVDSPRNPKSHREKLGKPEKVFVKQTLVLVPLGVPLDEAWFYTAGLVVELRLGFPAKEGLESLPRVDTMILKLEKGLKNVWQIFSLGFVTAQILIMKPILYRFPVTYAYSKKRNQKTQKKFLRILPIWITCLTYTVALAKISTLFTKLTATVNRSIRPNLNVPAAMLKTFISVTITICMTIYDRIFVPVATRVTRYPSDIIMLQRIGTEIHP
ncbi:OLC1v1015820C1 [Oldenlandia corymbosa var. corymbosa]|uniref:OLC1v1015820C1 n=1 Tax=Oldenlandia corymbosa var. corymbosa TaxID=529605 RepID=A0AAV1E4F6_OLDCO|nr:OLC1v1015820C1 [Oldenlandia corymbosa var. corymbosa]